MKTKLLCTGRYVLCDIISVWISEFVRIMVSWIKAFQCQPLISAAVEKQPDGKAVPAETG